MSSPSPQGSADHDHHGPAPLSEPKSPMWLPALGAVLFLTAGVYALVTCSGTDASSPSQGSAAAAGH